MRVFFDNVALDDSAILKCDMYAKLFGDTFKLGSTVCREVELWVEKSAITSHPNLVEPKDDLGNRIAYLHVDQMDDTNDFYYAYKLLDSMVLLNQNVDWGEIDPQTINNYLTYIGQKFNVGIPAIPKYGTMLIDNIDNTVTPRDFIGYVAELLGAYAYIDENNSIQFGQFSDTPIRTIDLDTCSDFKLGAHHQITRVVYDNLIHYEYGTSEGDTLYLNKDNVLLADWDSENTLDNMTEYVYTQIKDFEFNNVVVTECPIIDVLPSTVGRVINIGTYPTIIEHNYRYNGDWRGGYSIELKTEQQQETSVIDSALQREINKIDITLNRQDGLIDLMGESVNEMERNMIHFQVDAAKSEVRVTNQDTYTPDTYTSFKGDGMRIYVEDELVAEATAQRFNCNEGLGVQDWVIEHGEDAAVLMIYRRA